MGNSMYDVFGRYSAQSKYDEWNTTQIKLKLNNKTDQDILKWIQNKRYSRNTSVQGAIKELIRKDITTTAGNDDGDR